MLSCFATDSGEWTRPIWAIPAQRYEHWLAQRPESIRAWLEGSGFAAKAGRSALLPGAQGAPVGALLLLSDPAEPWDFAALRARLPAGTWRIEPGDAGTAWRQATLKHRTRAAAPARIRHGGTALRRA